MLTNASKAFGALKDAVFMDKNLSLTVERRLCNASVLPVLFYGAKCWAPLAKYINRTLFTIYTLFTLFRVSGSVFNLNY